MDQGLAQPEQDQGVKTSTTGGNIGKEGFDQGQGQVAILAMVRVPFFGNSAMNAGKTAFVGAFEHQIAAWEVKRRHRQSLS
jgi:hypothetical protein